MSFQLKADESVPKGVKRLVGKEIDDAVEALRPRGKGDRDEAVHDARKRLKKVRAALRLVRDEVGEDVYRAENVCFRDLARPLTEVRDAKVLLDTLDGLAEHGGDEVEARTFDGLRRALRANQREVQRRVLDEEGVLPKIKAALKMARRRVKDWPIEKDGWGGVEGGLQWVYKAARDAFAKAQATPAVETLHEWRKQVKYLWRQLQILEPVWPGVMEELADQAHQLADYLGDDHDLVVLRQTLEGDPQKYRDRAAVSQVLPLIDQRRTELERQAAFLGQRLHRDKPRDFVRRVKGYWKVWQSETENGASASG